MATIKRKATKLRRIKLPGDVCHQPKHRWSEQYRKETLAHFRKLPRPTDHFERKSFDPANGVWAIFIGGDMAGGNTATICDYVASLLPPEPAGLYQVKIRFDRAGDGTPTQFVFGDNVPVCPKLPHTGPQRFEERFCVKIPPHVWTAAQLEAVETVLQEAA
jgi:hypothetical protein